MAKDLSHLSDDELMKIASADVPQKPSPASQLSDEDLMKIASSDIGSDIEDANKMSRGQAARIGLERGVSFGFRPAIQGAAGGLGALIGQMEQNKPGEGLVDKIKRGLSAIPAAYEDSRKSAVAEEAQAAQDRPGYMMAGDLAGNVLTGPLVALKGLKGAAALGALQGAGRAVSEGEDLPDAAGKFAEGVGYGMAGYGAAKGLEAGAKTLGPAIKDAIGSAVGKIGEKTGNGLTKVASALTGVSEDDIKNYAKYADEISAMAKNSDNNIAEAADQLRSKFANSVNETRTALNSQISNALDASDKSVEAKPILDALAKQKEKINPVLYPKASNQIDEMMGQISALSKDGKLPVADAHEIKTFLQERAESAYGSPADPNSLGTKSAQAAKAGAAVARKLVNQAEPAVASANNQLSMIHNIMDNMNKNVLNSGKPEAALLAAGSGGNQRNKNALEALGKITNTDMVSDAQKLSAMRSFGNPQLLPVDWTGKAAGRLLAGGAAGGAFGGPFGVVAGMALTSPKGLKTAIDAGRISKSVIDAVMGKSVDMSEKGLGEVVKFINTPQGQGILNQVLNSQRVADGAISRRIQRLSKGSEQ